RIPRDQREEVGSSRRWIIVVALVVAVLLAAGAFVALRGQSFTVQTAMAAAPSAGGGSAAPVLQASGYVTARRQATVSAQITGTLTEVLIEEGERVEEGQVLARLEDRS